MNRRRTAFVLCLAAAIAGPARAQEAVPGVRHVFLARPVAVADGTVSTAVMIDAADSVVAGDVDLRLLAATTPGLQVRAGELLRGFLLLAHVVDDTLRVSFAGLSAARGGGALFEVVTQGTPALSLQQVSLNGGRIPVAFDTETAVAEGAGAPAPGGLRAFPNPFNAQTVIDVALAADGPLRLEVYGADGRRVRVLAQGGAGAGAHRFSWDGTDTAGRSVASGHYFVRLETGAGARVARLTLLR